MGPFGIMAEYGRCTAWYSSWRILMALTYASMFATFVTTVSASTLTICGLETASQMPETWPSRGEALSLALLSRSELKNTGEVVIEHGCG
jgi:hypothetical protein